jgi:nicotinic acid mononucleotide adenylyltransferase
MTCFLSDLAMPRLTAFLSSVAMCQLAVDQTSDWLMVDTWEPIQKAYQPTAVVLDHFDHEINVVRKGVEAGNGTRKPVRIALLAGADLIHTMSTPGVWSEKDLDHILGKYGVSLNVVKRPTIHPLTHSLVLHC